MGCVLSVTTTLPLEQMAHDQSDWLCSEKTLFGQQVVVCQALLKEDRKREVPQGPLGFWPGQLGRQRGRL